MREPLKENLKIFLIYVLLTCIYFNRIFIDGIVILTNDALLWNYPMREFYGQALRSFTFPLWNPYEFAGLPFIGQMQTGALYPPNALLYFLLPAPYAFNASFILHFALAGFFTFLYLRCIGLRKLPAFAGGAVFALSGFLVGHKPHTAILNASVWLPLILYFLERLRQTVEMRYAAMAALAVGVQLLAGNFQICFYTYIVLFAFFAYYAFVIEREKRGRYLIYGAASIVLGLIVASPQIYAVMELSQVSYRTALSRLLGDEFPSLYHVYISTLPSLIFPFLFGGGAYGLAERVALDDMMTPFTGAAAVLIALAALVVDRGNRHVRFWGMVAFIGLVLSLGVSTPLFDLLKHFPVYKAMRAHGRNLLEFSLAVSVLMAMGLEGIFYGEEKARKHLKTAAVALGAVLAVSLAAVLFIGYGGSGLSTYLSSIGYINPPALLESITLRNPAILIPIAFLAAYLLWCFTCMKKGTALMRYVVIALLVAEGFSYGAFHEMSGLPMKDIGRSYGMDDAYEFVRTSGPNRVLKVPIAQTAVSLYNVPRGVSSLNAYDPLSLEKYVRLLELNTVGLMPRELNQLEFLLKNNILLSALNAKYLILPRGMGVQGMNAVSVGQRPETRTITVNWRATGSLARKDGAFVFPPNGAQAPPKLVASVPLMKSTYYLSFKSRRRGTGQSKLEARVYYPPLYTRSHRLSILSDNAFRAEKTLFEATEDGEYIIAFTSDGPAEIELVDPELVSVTPYAPPLVRNAGNIAGSAIYPPVYEAGDYIIYENLNALPRAFMVAEAVPVADFAELNEKFYTLQINPGRQAMVYAGDSEKLGGLSFSPGTANIKEYGLNRVDIDADASGRGFLVLSEQYYPGWKAYVDGTETAIYETNGVMRGVVVPAGKHTVTFKYLPLKMFFLMGLGLLLAAALIYKSVTPRK